MAMNHAGPSGQRYAGMARSSPRAGGINPDLLSTARLLHHFDHGYPPEALYESALRNYDRLIELAESPDNAREMTLVLDLTEARIQADAKAVISLLLQNGENDPYTALGLPVNAQGDEVTRRWKRLVVLFHPDRNPHESTCEEITKKINEAYGKITANRKNAWRRDFTWSYQPPLRVQGYTANRLSFLRYLPFLILSAAIIVAVLSVLLLVRKVISPPPASRDRPAQTDIGAGHALPPGRSGQVLILPAQVPVAPADAVVRASGS